MPRAERYPAWFEPRILAALIKAAEDGGRLVQIIRRARAHRLLTEKALADFLRRHRPPTKKDARPNAKQMFVAEFNRRRGEAGQMGFHATPKQAERILSRAMRQVAFACDCGNFKRSEKDRACAECLEIEKRSAAMVQHDIRDGLEE